MRRTRRSIARSRAFAAAADIPPVPCRGRAEVSKIAPPPPRTRPRVAPGSVRIRRRRASRLRTQDHGGWVMLRTMMIALFASASVAMLAPDVASARGGFGGGGGGFHGGGGGGFRGGGGFGGGGFRGGGMGMGGGGFRAAGIGGGGFRAAAIGGGGFRLLRSVAVSVRCFAGRISRRHACRQPFPRWLPPRIPASPEISGRCNGSRTWLGLRLLQRLL